MSTSATRRAFLEGSLVLGGASIAGCSGKNGTDDASSSAAPAGNLSLCCLPPDDLNPASTVSPVSLALDRELIEGLFGLDPADLSVHPELAEATPRNLDDRTFEVELRQGIRFSDGTAVSARDVADSFWRTKNGTANYQVLLRHIHAVTPMGSRRLRVISDAGFQMLTSRLALVRVMPCALKKQQRSRQPLGSGPWAIEGMDEGSISLVANNHYKGDHPAQAATATIRFERDAARRRDLLLDGTVLASERVAPADVKSLRQAGCTVDEAWGLSCYLLAFNVARSPWNFSLARQAIMHVVDRQQIVDTCFAGLAEANPGMLPVDHPDYRAPCLAYDHDPDTARNLFSQVPDMPRSLTLAVCEGDLTAEVAAAVSASLREFGLSVRIKELDKPSPENLAADAVPDFDLLLCHHDPSSYGAETGAILSLLFDQSTTWMKKVCPWTESGAWKDLSGLMGRAVRERDTITRQDLWGQCQDLLCREVPIWPIVREKVLTASWQDTARSPAGTALVGFSGTGACGLSLLGTSLVGD